MKAPGGKFGRKKEEAIAALLTQRNIEEAAKAAGIGANTLLRWLKVAGLGILITHEKPPRFLMVNLFELCHTPGYIHQLLHAQASRDSPRPAADAVTRCCRPYRRTSAIVLGPV